MLLAGRFGIRGVKSSAGEFAAGTLVTLVCVDPNGYDVEDWPRGAAGSGGAARPSNNVDA